MEAVRRTGELEVNTTAPWTLYQHAAGDPMRQGIRAGIDACYDQLLSPEEKQQFAREMEREQQEQNKQTTPIAPVYFHGNATCDGKKIPHISDYSPTDPFK
jgi:hypothetical protein